MGKFTILKTEDASPYRDQILEFWDEYLAETPPGRFEWMCEGNPAGPATWFIAFEEGMERFSGT